MNSQKLKVQMLGNVSLQYDGIPIVLERTSTTNATKLLLYLLYHRDKKISKDTLINVMYGNEDIISPSNNLKVNLFRLRKILEASALPPNEYISFKAGSYSFNSLIPLEIDVEIFTLYAEQALTKDLQKEEKLLLLQKAIEVYTGEFLPMLSSMPWVILENIKYRDLYIKCIRSANNLIEENGDLPLMLDICSRALNIYPFDEEIHLLKIKCLIDMKNYFAALSHYEETTKLFYEELGVSPSEKMLTLYKQMTSKIKLNTSNINQIKDALKEKESPYGAYYCSYLGFVDSYRFIVRVIERTGHSIFLSLFTLTNLRGTPLEIGEKLSEASEALHDVIGSSLRRGDLYTRYSPNQFLVLLIGINYENCEIVSNRIKTKFKDEKNIRGVRLQNTSISGADLNIR